MAIQASSRGERGRASVLTQARWAVLLLYVLAAAIAAAQRGLGTHAHWTYHDFQQSFFHLVRHQDLYAHYATQGYDLYKYSPTFALLFAPLSVLPVPLGLLLWDLCNALALYLALALLLPTRQATLAALVLTPEVFAAVQASQSDALVAALLILSFVALERRHRMGAAAAIGVGAAVKIFPLAALAFAIPRPGRRRFALAMVASAIVLVALPLLIIPPRELAWQYGSWMRMARTDALYRGASVMGLIGAITPGAWPNWPVQLAGTLLLLLPLALRRDGWTDAGFRRLFLCSLLVYAVIFNHKAERSSFVIAAAGIVIWWVTGPRTLWRTALMVLSLVGLGPVPFVLAWVAMQVDLLRGVPGRAVVSPVASHAVGAVTPAAAPVRSSPS